MNRRDEIRAAMQSLLSSELRDVALPAGNIDSGMMPPPEAYADLSTVTGGAQTRTLEELQVALRENGIEAERSEIANAILQATLVRPTLCRGLLAAYFLEPDLT